MKLSILLLITALTAAVIAAQTDLDKLVETERSFAKAAADRGSKAAFLEFMAPDAVVFVPDKTTAKPYWQARTESGSYLSWAPNYADISSNGLLGYTTGNWEFRPKSKTDEPTAFGEFVTVWLRQPSGQFRWVVDIGIGHSSRGKFNTDLTPPPNAGPAPGLTSAAEYANGFFNMAATQGLKKAYERYAADDVRCFREDLPPGQGKKELVSFAEKLKANVAFAKRSMFFETADVAYVTNTYQVNNNGTITEKGNSMQIWKYRNGRWLIVLDILKALPEKQS
jgi:ketosteroid isomerase-like protein